MATINYNGMELEEFKELKVFDSPLEMCVWNDNGGLPTVLFVCAVIPYRHAGQVITTNGAYEHCALLPDPPKPRRATNRELSRWLAQGNGECLGSQDDADTAWNYRRSAPTWNCGKVPRSASGRTPSGTIPRWTICSEVTNDDKHAKI